MIRCPKSKKITKIHPGMAEVRFSICVKVVVWIYTAVIKLYLLFLVSFFLPNTPAVAIVPATVAYPWCSWDCCCCRHPLYIVANALDIASVSDAVVCPLCSWNFLRLCCCWCLSVANNLLLLASPCYRCFSWSPPGRSAFFCCCLGPFYC